MKRISSFRNAGFLLAMFTGFILSILGTEAKATHFMGGEIRWECMPNGNYRFIVRLYRECAGVPYSNSLALEHNVPAGNIDPAAVNEIVLNLYPTLTLGRTDLSPQCNGDPTYPHITCQTTTISNSGGVEEWYYTSDLAFPNGVQISGVPPSTGYIFSFDVCNRNPCQNIQSASNLCAHLKATMYPYAGQSVNPCWDNSPLFAERPQTVVAAGYPAKYNPTAYDMDGDSIVYHWAQPYDNSTTVITNYYPGYSYTNPLPGLVFNPGNVAATLDTFSGQLEFTSFTTGAYVTKYMVTEFRNAVKIAEIEREMQVVILATGANPPPETTLPFPSNVNPYVDTVYFGSTVNFSFAALDTGLQNNGMSLQNILVDVNGVMMGTNDTSGTGCPVPPCAHLDVPTPIVGTFMVGANFSWETTVNHLIFGGLQNPYVDYYFIFSAKDDFCPVPGSTMVPVKIVVKDFLLPPPQMGNYQHFPNGDVKINWTPVANDSTNSFRYYLIYYKNASKTDFQVIDTVFDINQAEYTHIGATNLSPYFFYCIKTVSGHAGAFQSKPSSILTNYTIGIPEQLAPDISLVYDPQSGEILILNAASGIHKLDIFLYTTMGQLVMSSNLGSSANSGRMKGSHLPSGIYLYRIDTGHKSVYGKIRISR